MFSFHTAKNILCVTRHCPRTIISVESRLRLIRVDLMIGDHIFIKMHPNIVNSYYEYFQNEPTRKIGFNNSILLTFKQLYWKKWCFYPATCFRHWTFAYVSLIVSITCHHTDSILCVFVCPKKRFGTPAELMCRICAKEKKHLSLRSGLFHDAVGSFVMIRCARQRKTPLSWCARQCCRVQCTIFHIL